MTSPFLRLEDLDATELFYEAGAMFQVQLAAIY